MVIVLVVEIAGMHRGSTKAPRWSVCEVSSYQKPSSWATALSLALASKGPHWKRTTWDQCQFQGRPSTHARACIHQAVVPSRHSESGMSVGVLSVVYPRLAVTEHCSVLTY